MSVAGVLSVGAVPDVVAALGEKLTQAMLDVQLETKADASRVAALEDAPLHPYAFAYAYL